MASSHPFPPFSLHSPLKKNRHPPPLPILNPKISPPPHSFLANPRTHLSITYHNPSHASKISSFSSNNVPSTRPPSSREEAILQAKTSLSSTLQKPLSNPILLPRQKLRKQKQPRFRVEIPVVDDSSRSLAQLAYDVFAELPIKRKGSVVEILILWSDPAAVEDARKLFVKMPNRVSNFALASIESANWSSADVVVFAAPETSDLDRIRLVSDELYPRPVVLFNPNWGFEEEDGFKDGLGSFAGSFEVVYSFMGLEVRGIMSKRKGVVMRSVRDGVFSGEGWVVLVEDEENQGEMRVVTQFKKRPAVGEVENVLYNLMAANSPVTKSVKFIRDLASNVIGRKEK